MEIKKSERKEKRIEPPVIIVAPDGGWGWFVVFGSMLAHIIIGGQERANGILYLAIMNKFNGSATITAGLVSFTTAFQLLIGPISGALIKKYSGRTITATGGMLLFLSFLLSSFVSSVEFLFLSYALLGGIGKSLAYTASIIMVGYYFDKRRGIAVGLTTAGVGIGTFTYAPIMEWTFKTYSFFGTMLILGAISLNLCVCAMLYRPLQTRKAFLISQELTPIDDSNSKPNFNFDSSQTVNTSLVEPNATVPQRTNQKLRNRASISSRLSQFVVRLQNSLDVHLFRNWHFLFFCLNICMFTSSHWSIPVFLPALAIEKGIKEMQAALLISIIGISDLVSRIIMGFFLDLKWVKPYRRFLFTIIIGLQVIMTFSCSYANAFWEFSVICASYGCLSGGTIAQLSIIVVDLLGVEKLASSFGWTLCFQGIGILIGPPLAGLIRDSYKNYSFVYFFAGGLMLAGFFFLLISAFLFCIEEKKETTQSDLQGNE